MKSQAPSSSECCPNRRAQPLRTAAAHRRRGPTSISARAHSPALLAALRIRTLHALPSPSLPFGALFLCITLDLYLHPPLLLTYALSRVALPIPPHFPSRMEQISATRDVAFGASKRAWMGKRINILKQLRFINNGPKELKQEL